MISSLDQKKATGTEYNDGICDLELAQRLTLFVRAQEEETQGGKRGSRDPLDPLDRQ